MGYVAHNEQWDTTENKTTVVGYGAGSIVALWASSTIVGAINAVPLVRQRHVFENYMYDMQGA